MKLVLARKARMELWDEPRPDMRTLRQWIIDEVVPGKIFGRRAYVDVDALQQAGSTTTGNTLADRILAKAAHG